MEVKITTGKKFKIIQERYGLQLNVETILMKNLCLHLRIFCSDFVPQNGAEMLLFRWPTTSACTVRTS
jgi:hypothetical protein